MESVSSQIETPRWNPADAMAKARREAAQSLDQASGRILHFISSAVHKAEEAAKRAAGAGPDLEVGDAKRQGDVVAGAAERAAAAQGGGSGEVGGGVGGGGGRAGAALFSGMGPSKPKQSRVQAEVSALLRGHQSGGGPAPPERPERVGESAVANVVAQALALARHQPKLVLSVVLLVLVSFYLKLVTHSGTQAIVAVEDATTATTATLDAQQQ